MQFSDSGFELLKTLKNVATVAHIDANGPIDDIQEFEGLRLKAYLDTAGVPTIGWGSTRYLNGTRVKMGDVVTRKQADDLLYHTVMGFEAEVNSLIKVPLNQHQFDALVSFQYNTGALSISTLLKKLNAKDYQGAADQFPAWNKITKNGIKVVSDTLVKRRAIERRLFLTAA